MNLVFQYFIGGEVPEYAKISRFSFTEYADKLGHEYFFTDKEFLQEEQYDGLELGRKYFDIIRIYMDPFFDQYDQVLFVDADVIAHPNAPDIFTFNPKHIAGWTEQKHPNGIVGPGYDRGSEKFCQIEKAFAEFNAPLVDSISRHAPTRILNSGVLIFSKEARLIAREKFEDWKTWYQRDYRPWITLDQLYLSAMFNKYELDVVEMGNEWNLTPSWFPSDLDITAHFYHFSGVGKHDMSEFFMKHFKDMK